MRPKNFIAGMAGPLLGLGLIASAAAQSTIPVTASLNTPPGWNASAGPSLLTDGVVGGNDWVGGGQYLGWQDAGYVPTDSGTDSALPQPLLSFDLGGRYFVDSVTIHYIVDYPPDTLRANLRAPDSLTARFSLAGTNGPFDGALVETGFDDSPDGQPTGGQPRSVTISLGGTLANALELDFRTDGEWLFLSEVTFEGRLATNAPATATAILDTAPNFNASAGAGLLTDGIIGGNDWLTAPWRYLGWSDPGYVSTPPDSGVDSGVSQPQLTFDLGTNQLVDSITIHYIVDYPPDTLRANLRAPDSMTLTFSTNGPGGPFGGDLVETNFNDGSEAGTAAGVGEARSLVLNLGGMPANALRMDFRTDGEWLFLSEVIINILVPLTNTPPPVTNALISATAALDTTAGWNAAAGPGLLTDGVIGGNEWVSSGQYLGWSDSGYVPVDGGSDSGLPQPQLTFDFGAHYFVDTVTIHYLVDYPVDTLRANLRAPDSLAVGWSGSGPGGPFSGSLVETNFDDSPDSDTSSGWGQARALTLNLGGQPANAMRLDFRTDGEWLFVSEVVFRGRAVTNIPSPIAATVILDSAPNFNAPAGPALLTDGLIGGNDWLTGTWRYLGWQDPGYSPTPPDSGTDSGVAQPQLTFDFGGNYWLDSVTLHYMVDYPPGTLRANVRAPDSMTAMFSLSGPGGPFGGNLVETGFDDGPEGSATAGVGEARTLTVDLGGTIADALRLDFRTDGEWLFLSEVTIIGTAVPGPQIVPSVHMSAGLTTLRMTCDTVPGLWYRVVRAEALPAESWSEVAPGWTQGTGLPMEVTADVSPAQPQGFFRVEVSRTQP